MWAQALAFCLIISYFLVERKLRFGKEAQSLSPTTRDKNTTTMMWLSIYGTLALLLIGVILTSIKIAFFSSYILVIIGLLLMVCGFGLRVSAALTLRDFYTRTLRVLEKQTLITEGIYRFIRHPGYAGMIYFWIGASMTTANWLVVCLVIILQYCAYSKRILAEEDMMNTSPLADEYRKYAAKTARIFPFVF
eukprot:TRINITY_DN1775_c0_g1_i1.p1 TRINITY_DN1775_c0_g1~~TRINITY_DN1775_c0_g1_i1.p1  ORF type:complete len:192 (+),score=38.57 TRINITY_DN1775_c0_g1_i1:130-705(+)